MLEIVSHIDFGIAFHEQTHNLVVPGACCQKQSRFTHSVAGVNRRAGLEQRLG